MLTRRDIMSLGFELNHSEYFSPSDDVFNHKELNLALWLQQDGQVAIITRDPSLNEEYMRTNVDPNKRTFTPKDVKELKEMLNISTKE